MYVINTKMDKPENERLLNSVREMMKRGIRVKNLNEIEKQYIEFKEGLAEDIKEKFGILNPNSPKQVVAFIKQLSDKITSESPNERNDVYEACCIVDYRTHEEKWTSNSKALEQLSDLGYEFATELLEYRAYKKRAESITSIKNFVDKNDLIHPTVTLTKTNRISYKDPALMNIPKALLWEIIEPYDNNDVLYSIDIKNQEPSILINILQEKELLDALKSDDGLYETLFKRVYQPEVTMNILVDTFEEDRIYTISEIQNLGFISPAYYSPKRTDSNNVYYKDSRIIEIETVCQGYSKEDKSGVVYPDTVKVVLETGEVVDVKVEWDRKTKIKKAADTDIKGKLLGCDVRIGKAERAEFKVSWLALTYGASSKMIKETCKIINGDRLYKYFTQLPMMKVYRNNINKLASSGIQSVNTIFGDKVYADKDTRADLRRSLLDLPIQGTGAGILDLLVKHFNSEVKNRSLNGVYVYYTRHDELIIEASKETINNIGKEEFEKELRDITEHQVVVESENGKKTEWIPFKVEIEQLESLDEQSEIEFEDI